MPTVGYRERAICVPKDRRGRCKNWLARSQAKYRAERPRNAERIAPIISICSARRRNHDGYWFITKLTQKSRASPQEIMMDGQQDDVYISAFTVQ